ncbi:UNVERIFIED_CONTAM: hypothetical protein Slati_3871900 [Sesamum latifolium]|uniref:SWIM-type domain-containing protein n=1 Tax=Sesamum latifolium TaxID=2727402 RepID=A0AAW2TKU8_9LAMI
MRHDSRGPLCHSALCAINNYGPNIQKVTEELKKKSMEYIAHWNGHDQFEIEGCYDDKHTLNLTKQICSCRKWQLIGIPCAHAVSAIFFMGFKPDDYMDECYRRLCS